MDNRIPRYDMIKIICRPSSIENYDKKAFIEKIAEENKYGVLEDFDVFFGQKASNPYLGIQYIKIVNKIYIKDQESKSNMNTYVIMKISSKILGKNYYEMMNRNNFHKVIENINKTGLIKIRPEGFVEEAKVISCDVTCNLKMESKVYEHIENLKKLAIANHRITIKYYSYENSHRLSSLSLTTKARKTYRKKIRIYDKYHEIMCKNKAFKFLSQKQKERFKNILRIEISLNSFKQIRKYLHIQNSIITLKDVLNSDANPISRQLRELLRLKNFKNLYDETDNIITHNERKKEARRIRVLKIKKQNLGCINTILKTKYRSLSYYRAKYIKTYVKINKGKLKKALSDFMKIRSRI